MLLQVKDNISEKSDKYVEHGAAISKLIPPEIARALRELERNIKE